MGYVYDHAIAYLPYLAINQLLRYQWKLYSLEEMIKLSLMSHA